MSSVAPSPDSSDTESVEQQPHRSWIKNTAIQSAKTIGYALFLIVAVGLILFGIEALARYSVSRSELGRIYAHKLSLAKLDHTQAVTHYAYDFNPGVCVIRNRMKGNPYEYVNRAGFREPREISRDKPDDEFRIFLTGGSTAFGLGPIGEAAVISDWRVIPYHETISHMLEMILNAANPLEGKTIRVYNTAVWGYTYQHHVMRYVTKLRAYQPDLVISLDGANELDPISDLSDDWDYFRQGQYSNVMQEIFDYSDLGMASYLTLWLKNNTYCMTWLWSQRDSFHSLSASLRRQQWQQDWSEIDEAFQRMSDTERSRRIDEHVRTVVNVVENYHYALANDRVAHLFVLQPWLYAGKKEFHEREKKLLELDGRRYHYGLPSDGVYRHLIRRLTESANSRQYIMADFTRIFDDTSAWVFTDWCHLTEGANYIIARYLANAVRQYVFRQEVTATDGIANKDSYFIDLAASATVASAPPPVDPAHDARNALMVYPQEGRMYASQEVGPDKKLEMVLELARKSPVSRLRLVWADDEAVPARWTVETSDDGEEWQPFVSATSSEIDRYSRWPGFEYYAAEPVWCTHVRYRPIDPETRTIRLRAWALRR